MWTRLILAVVTAASLGAALPAQQASPAAPGGKVDFGRDVQPLFRQNCYGCHGASQQKNGFRLDRRRDAFRGGTGVVIGRGNGEASRLYLRLIGDRYGQQMPPTGALRPEQVATIKAWIDEGAEWPDELSGETPPTPPDANATRLMAALRAGNHRAADTMSAADWPVANLKGPGGSTPLMFATLYSDAATVAALLDHGADPNIKNDAGATALMWAVADLEKTRLLLDHGAQADPHSGDGRTPLIIAAGIPGALPVVTLLLDRGASVSSKGPGLFGDTTPLLAATLSGDEATFHALIAHGADVNAGGPVPLGLALRAECRSCVEALLKSMNPALFTPTMLLGGPPLGPALATNLMLDHGADPKAVDPDGRTPLMLAAASDALPVEAVKALIDRGVDVNVRSSKGETALSFAAQHGHTPIVDLLIAAGATAVPAPIAPAAKPAPAASIRVAVERSVPLLQRSDVTFLKKSGCVSCHNNSLAAMTVAIARRKGLAVDDGTARQQSKLIGAYLESWRERALQGIGIPGDADTVSYLLVGLAAEQFPADSSTDAMAHFLKGQQVADGHWRILAHRPPIESNDIEVTAASMRALQVYGPAGNRAPYDHAVRRAAAWLAQAKPVTTEERAFQLLGLGWAQSSEDAIRVAGRALVAEQRADGGWAQIPSLASDAYATGQALVALAESGAISTADPAYKRGVQFLLNSQYADGSWFVRTRAVALQPHFETGFPYGRDQFISAAGSNWATMALALAYVKPS
jgi:ankyrin repeat protein/mono/diheme cytochrome c family protein